MFKNFCHSNAAVSDLSDSKSKNKIAVIFFPNSHGSYTVPEIWQVTHVIVTFHFGLFFALPPSPL